MKNLKLKNKLLKLLITGNVVVILTSTVGVIKTLGDQKALKNNEPKRGEIIFNTGEQIDPNREYPEVENMFPELPANYPQGTEDQITTDTLENTFVTQETETFTTTEETTTNNDDVITFTDNITQLSNDVSLINNYGYIIEGSINDIIAYNNPWQIVGINGRAVSIAELNIRKGPGTNHDVITYMKNGTNIGIYGRTENDWYLVNYNGIVGFVSGQYIQLLDVNYDEENNVIYSVLPQVELAIEPTTKLNVRSGNGTDYDKIGLISGNRKYKVIEKCDNGWYHIDYNGQDGYVSGDYVKETCMLFGDFYRFVYLKNDSYLYDGDGYQKGVVSKYEGGKVYSEDETRYLVSVGDDFGYINKSDCRIIEGKVINIDLSLQQLEIISDGKVILTTDVVTGKDSTPSDEGYFKINAIRRDTYLVGTGYRTFVNYFGPYNGGEGIHDASWQNGHFGDVDYYHKGGSHGCINMPPDITPEVFDNVEKGTLVLVHK